MRQPPDSFQSRLDPGVENILVELWNPIMATDAAETIASFYLSTWGDPTSVDAWDTDSESMRNVAKRHAEDAMSGKVLPNTLESVALTFSVQGLTRATTHQLVRSRVGAVFGQQGGRDNNWSDFNLRIPATFNGAMSASKVVAFRNFAAGLYKDAIEAGVPFQDARYILPMGLETSLVGSYNLLSFKGLANRRLCNRMMWETNYVVRVMTDLVVQAFPFVGRNLRSSCEQRGVCASVSPLFPPADLTMVEVGQGRGRPKEMEIDYARDNPTLMENRPPGTAYDNLREQNGCFIHSYQKDLNRLELEEENSDIIVSLVDGETVLAVRVEGLWESV